MGEVSEMSDPVFRPLRSVDLPLVAHWQGRLHVARWWKEPADLASVTSRYLPTIDGRDPTEAFIIEFGGEPIGLIQRYLLADNPDWAGAMGIDDGIGIDYFIGEQPMTGKGIGTRIIARFAEDTFVRFPAVPLVVAAPQQDNVASWRALEKAGFRRVAAKQLESDDPSDAGPAYIYVLRRPGPPSAARSDRPGDQL
jgi:aminoglycoside 6'-N-acetyltransferase